MLVLNYLNLEKIMIEKIFAYFKKTPQLRAHNRIPDHLCTVTKKKFPSLDSMTHGQSLPIWSRIQIR